MEIERKFLIKRLPKDLSSYPCRRIEQAYLNRDPALRVRRQDDLYFLTCKSRGLMEREEWELPLDAEAYAHLLAKADGRIIRKTRYLIPYQRYTVELDMFDGDLAPLLLAEVEFTSAAEADAFVPPDWFGEDVTSDPSYQNVNMALRP